MFGDNNVLAIPSNRLGNVRLDKHAVLSPYWLRFLHVLQPDADAWIFVRRWSKGWLLREHRDSNKKYDDDIR